jgi:glycosyltransferase involved in cell wall biosynthesis
MKISVVIPLYNKEKSILRAINSVLNQTEQDFELIVVNDGSTDQSASLVASLSDNKKIRLIHQENAGVSAARNRGIAEANSELIAFLDADDEWLPEFLMTILTLKSQFPRESVFSSLYSFQDSTGKTNLPKSVSLFESGYRGILDNFLDIIHIGLPFNSSTVVVAQKALEEIGGFPVGIAYGEDVDTWIRLSLRYKIVYVNKVLAIYHRDAENRACDKYDHLVAEYYPAKNLIQMVKKGEVPNCLRQSAIEYIAKYQLSLAKHNLYYANPVQARELIYSCSGTEKYLGNWLFLYFCTFVPPSILQKLIQMKSRLQ